MQYKQNLLFPFNTLQIRFSLFILFDEIRSNNYPNTLSGESIVCRLLVTVDEPERVHSIGKLEVRANNLDFWTINLTQNLKTDYCRGFLEFKFYLTGISNQRIAIAFFPNDKNRL